MGGFAMLTLPWVNCAIAALKRDCRLMRQSLLIRSLPVRFNRLTLRCWLSSCRDSLGNGVHQRVCARQLVAEYVAGYGYQFRVYR